MDFLSDYDEQMSAGDTYDINFGKRIQRTGKIFSYTFWRTEVAGEIFWSVQGNKPDGSAWVVTKYFGPREEGKRYQQEVILHHPVEKKIKMQIIHHFKNANNSFNFEFRLLKLKRRPYPKRMLFDD
ncbi:hypothetical protein MTP99_012294 [Tenebrio molitor]|nr:hypothetical protein MTP99_012294 [Tenebrio molitor]